MNFSTYIIPLFLFAVLLCALIKKKDAFGAFTSGVKDSLSVGLNIFPNILAVMCGAAMLQASGAMDILKTLFSPVFKLFGVPAELSFLALLRPVSGSGSIAVLSDLMKNFGADSFVSKTACVIMASTETSIYTTAVYFGVTKVKNTRHTLTCALLADFFCVVFSCAVCHLFFAQ